MVGTATAAFSVEREGFPAGEKKCLAPRMGEDSIMGPTPPPLGDEGGAELASDRSTTCLPLDKPPPSEQMACPAPASVPLAEPPLASSGSLPISNVPPLRASDPGPSSTDSARVEPTSVEPTDSARVGPTSSTDSARVAPIGAADPSIFCPPISAADPNIFWLNSRPYWLGRLLGRGGFGEVHEVELLLPLGLMVDWGDDGGLQFDENGCIVLKESEESEQPESSGMRREESWGPTEAGPPSRGRSEGKDTAAVD